MHRKIELQAPADITYLYANTVTLSRQKLNLHLPPSATNDTEDAPDPMRERVRELVDEVPPLPPFLFSNQLLQSQSTNRGVCSI